jgi:transposase
MSRRSCLEPLALSSEDRTQLQQWARRGKGARSLALRARIVLRCNAGRSNREVARALGVTTQTVGKWRTRFAARGSHGLLDEPRPGAPRSISDELVEAVLAKTLHERPPDAKRWSRRRLASALGISQRAVLRISRTFDV